MLGDLIVLALCRWVGRGKMMLLGRMLLVLSLVWVRLLNLNVLAQLDHFNFDGVDLFRKTLQLLIDRRCLLINL